MRDRTSNVYCHLSLKRSVETADGVNIILHIIFFTFLCYFGIAAGENKIGIKI